MHQHREDSDGGAVAQGGRIHALQRSSEEFTMKYYKTVLIPFEVCTGDHCAFGPCGQICSHFDNEGGYGMCEILGDVLSQAKDGSYPKPDVCKNAVEVTE